MQEPPIDWRGNAFRKAAPFLFIGGAAAQTLLCR